MDLIAPMIQIEIHVEKKEISRPVQGCLRISSLHNDSFITRSVYLSSCQLLIAPSSSGARTNIGLYEICWKVIVTTTKMSFERSYFSNKTVTRSNFVIIFLTCRVMYFSINRTIDLVHVSKTQRRFRSFSRRYENLKISPSFEQLN